MQEALPPHQPHDPAIADVLPQKVLPEVEDVAIETIYATERDGTP